jgi:hypothetical protein
MVQEECLRQPYATERGRTVDRLDVAQTRNQEPGTRNAAPSPARPEAGIIQVLEHFGDVGRIVLTIAVQGG